MKLLLTILLLATCVTARVRPPAGLFIGPYVPVAVDLAWNPSTNDDGSVNTNLSGYNIYWGTNASNYTHQVDAGLNTNLTISYLQPGVVYHIAATSYDQYGDESSFCAEIVWIGQ
jgi:hypothetical protein